MKKTLFVAAAAAALVATPALANDFTGPRAEVTIGADDVIGSRTDLTDVTYGVGVGYDVALLKNVVAGVEANVDNVFDRRNAAAGVRVGYTVTDNVLVYGKVGYANWKQTPTRELEGLRLGGGVETTLRGNVYGKVEYRYTDYEGNVGQHAGLVGVGVRF